MAQVMQLLPVVRSALGHARSAGVQLLPRLHLDRQLASEAAAQSQTPQEPIPAQEPIVHVACVLERLPIVAGPPPAWRAEYNDWIMSRELQAKLRTDYPEVKQIYAPDAESQPSGTKRATSEPATLTAEPFTVPITPEDKANNLRSMRRALGERLYLLVKHKGSKGSDAWQFPHTQVQDTESLRSACERALVSSIGRRYPTYFIGNGPMAHLADWKTGKGGSHLFFMLAQVVEDPWGPLPLPSDGPVSDYAWLTRDQLTQQTGDKRLAELIQRLLP